MVDILREMSGFYDRFDVLLLLSPHRGERESVKETRISQEKDLIDVVNPVKKVYSDHIEAHVANGYYQSPYRDAIILVCDGSSDTYGTAIYKGHKENLKLVDFIGGNPPGKAYREMAYSMNDIESSISNKNQRIRSATFSTKFMEMSIYGNKNEHMAKLIGNEYPMCRLDKLRDITKKDLVDYSTYQKLGKINTGEKFYKEIKGQAQYDIAWANQRGFERYVFSIVRKAMEKYPNYPLVFAGGCAANLLLNTKLRNKYEIDIPANPGASGTSLGMILDYLQPEIGKRPRELHNKLGVPVLDMDILDNLRDRMTTFDQVYVARLIRKGKTIGIMDGLSGNHMGVSPSRCIISKPGNEEAIRRIKQREGFRPVAMAEINPSLPEYTCYVEESESGTVAKQSVPKDRILYKILESYGEPILISSLNYEDNRETSRISEVLEMLEKTELDYLIVNGMIINKESLT